MAVTVAGGTATLGSGSSDDFTVSGTGVTNNAFTISIPDGSVSNTGTFDLTAPIDAVVEVPPETVTVSGSATVAGASVTAVGASVRIADRGVALSFEDSGGDELTSLGEGSGSTQVTVKAVLPPGITAPAGGVLVGVNVVGGSADLDSDGAPFAAGEDFRVTGLSLPSGTPSGYSMGISIPEGASEGTATFTLVVNNDAVVEGPTAETVQAEGSPVTISGTEYLATGASLGIDDDDLGITLTLSGSSVAEGAGNAGGVTVTPSFTGASDSTLTSATEVELSFTAGAGGEAADFTAPGTAITVSIPAGATSGSAVALTGLGITDDAIAEDAEVITVGGTVTGFTVGAASLSIAASDRDVTLVADTDSGASGDQKGLAEGSAVAVRVKAEFTSATSNDLAAALSVSVTASEASTVSASGGGTDFTAPSAPVTVTIPTGSTSTSGSYVSLAGLLVTDDSRVEAAETFEVTGTAAAGVTVTADTLTIAASDTGITLSASPGTVVEQAAAHRVTVTAAFTGASASDLGAATDVTVTVAGGTATLGSGSGDDFTVSGAGVSSNSFTVTIPAGSVSSTGGFDLTAADDTAVEVPPETVTVSGSATVAGGSVTADGASIRIADEGVALSLEDSGGGALTSLGEGSGSTQVTVKAVLPSGFTAPSGGAVVGVNVVGGTAVLDSDGAPFGAGEDFRVTGLSQPTGTPAGYSLGIPVAAGATEGTATFTLVVNNDAVVEGPAAETVQVLGSDVTVSGGGTLPTTEASLDIDDDDLGITLTLSELSVAESAAGNAGGVTVTPSFTGASGSVLTSATEVELSFTAASGTEAADFTAPGTAITVSIPAGATSGSAVALTGLGITDDAIAEDAEAITVGGTVTGFTVGAVALSIAASDQDVTLVADTDSGASGDQKGLAEGDTVAVRVKAEFTSATSNDLAAPLSVDVTASEASTPSAVGGGTDFTAPSTPVAVSIPIGSTSTSSSYTDLTGLLVTDDSRVEAAETFEVTGTAAAGVTVTADTLTIAASDTHMKLSASPSQVPEQTDAHTITVEAVFDSASASDLGAATDVTVTVAGGTATLGSGGDFTVSSSSFTITIPDGSVRSTATFDLTAIDDLVLEPAATPETVTVSGSATVAGAAATVEPAQIVIVDPGGGIIFTPAPEVSVDNESVAENAGTVTVTVRLTGESNIGFTVSASTVNGSALAGSDYQAVVDRELNFAGTDGETQTFPVAIIDDNAVEETESFSIQLSVPSDSGVDVAGTGTITITNEDEPPPPPPPPPPPGRGGGGGGGGPSGPTDPPPFSPPPAETTGIFRDDDGSVHQSNIERIAQEGITLGCGQNNFCPGRSITRSQMAAFLYRAVIERPGAPAPAPSGVVLSDVPAEAGWAQAADWVVSIGAFAAPGGVFDPGGLVTRADMAVMMVAAFSHLNAVDEAEMLFADVAGRPDDVVRAVEGLYQTRITLGCGEDPLRYCPDEPVTRAQMASFFARALDAAPPPPPAETWDGTFRDDDESVHQLDIERIAREGITLGCGQNNFCPGRSVTRSQMAAFLYRAVVERSASPAPAPSGVELSDVPAEAGWALAADWVVSIGAFAAPEGVFDPDGLVTRADMAVMMVAAFSRLNAVDESKGLFADVSSLPDDVVRAVEGLYQARITLGCGFDPLRYCPDEPVTRAQMASFLSRALDVPS